jgi:hypothetical protein
VIPELKRLLEYFTMVEWERRFTIKEGELWQHGKAWSPTPHGWFTNREHEDDDWSIFGPYVLDPPLCIGLYEATYVLRSRVEPTAGNPINGNAVIDVATSGGGFKGSRTLAASRLSPMDTLLGKGETETWRKHSLLFFYDGDTELEFRILRDWRADNKTGRVVQGTYTMDFSHITVRKLAYQLT